MSLNAAEFPSQHAALMHALSLIHPSQWPEIIKAAHTPSETDAELRGRMTHRWYENAKIVADVVLETDPDPESEAVARFIAEVEHWSEPR